MITQAELKELLHYDPETSVFTRKVALSNNHKVGDVAGSLKSNGYFDVRVGGSRYLAHRLVWLWHFGTFPDHHIDHINGIKTDNRIENLRDVSQQENCKNAKRSKNNTSGVPGVYWFRRDQKWRAVIMVNGKNLHLGYFENKEDAIRVRKNAEKFHNFHKNHGRAA